VVSETGKEYLSASGRRIVHLPNQLIDLILKLPTAFVDVFLPQVQIVPESHNSTREYGCRIGCEVISS
jgi:hypothetical protein